MSTGAISHLSVLADQTRIRLLLVLEGAELSVGELSVALQLPQSSISRHLKALSEDGWLVARADGASRYYRRAVDRSDVRDRLWEVLRTEAAMGDLAGLDRERVATVIGERRRRSREFFTSVAGGWEAIRKELSGGQADLEVALAMADPRWVVGDLGCGAGHLSALVAPYVSRVIAVDDSAEMLDAARERTAALRNVEVRRGELEALPIGDESLDLALLSLVLRYTAEPVRVLAEARRVLAPGGRVLVLDLRPQERAEPEPSTGPGWPGFSEAQLREWCGDAGLRDVTWRALAPVHDAKGPPLFMVRATR